MTYTWMEVRSLDYRDPNTVWIWLSDKLYIELTKEKVIQMLKGFDQDEE